MARTIGWLAGLAGAGAAAVASGAPVPAPASAGGAVAVELFTSQGCSSCPPADAVLAKLAREPGVVAITRPVTYWDRLGWKDTLASPANTALQQGYTRRGITGAGNYTPQMVVAGRAGAVGGQEARVRGLIAQARRLPAPALTVERTGGIRTVAVRGGRPAVPAELSLLALRRQVPVAIGSGENGGRRITYANVLVDERPLGRWAGGATRFALPAGATAVRGADRYAVLLRQGMAGPVLAARYLP